MPIDRDVALALVAGDVDDRAVQLMSTYEDMAEMIRLGAYRKGSSPDVDQAIQYYPAIENFLRQRKDEKTTLDAGYDELAKILNIKDWRKAK